MRQCLTSPEGGYYTTKNQAKDQFGRKGDFITSPEISQVFGELIGIWLYAEWMAQGKVSKGVELVELGPGRGTLMDDMLRTLSTFRQMRASIDSVYLIETSPSLRETQRLLLCGEAPFETVDIGIRSISKYSGIPITWCEDIRFVPKGATKTPFIVAHEFFDALPIHAFQSVPPRPSNSGTTLQTPTGLIPLSNQSPQSKQNQWRELLVSTAPPPNLVVPHAARNLSDTTPDFQLTLAKASNPTSLLLPNRSERYKTLLHRAGSTIEISPESHSYVAQIAQRIGGAPPNSTTLRSQDSSRPLEHKATPSGAALILDYGPSGTVPISTFRGIRSHKVVSPFFAAGQVDLSADVDFTALAEAALHSSSGVEVHGPVEQGTWLEAMGIRTRAEMLCKGLERDEAGRKRVVGAVERLVERGGGGMGKLYKVMAIVPERGGRRPVGFGGEIGG
ncbi:uncharacterized protein KY384_005477 [Bacidia gigantensis]|uniref:uncharacterized protein n=1 Tax=Bacidia gigantensis TaxID=2732470 RepID=UPI001D052BC4|nr:uncharacterized protein KY384_005477 [Bacidia gigantensis]KAG8529995.1 hypothetical protein KY384_005477 [Bacidia gigantensis]